MNAPSLPTPRPWTELEPAARDLPASEREGTEDLEAAIHAWDDLAAHLQERRHELKCSPDRATGNEELRSRVRALEEGPPLGRVGGWSRGLILGGGLSVR
jgi:hypothetical protein